MVVGIMKQTADLALHERRMIDASYALRRIARDEEVDEEIREKAAKLAVKIIKLGKMLDKQNDRVIKETIEKIKEDKSNYLY